MLRVERLTGGRGLALVEKLRHRLVAPDSGCRDTVAGILEQVRSQGDEALLHYCRKFDAPEMTIQTLRVSEEEFSQAEAEIDDQLLTSLRLAAERIRAFHQREMEDSWFLTQENGTITGRLVRAVDSAGLYVPGGQAGSTPLVSSVLMNGIPAAIAGVRRRVMVTPPDRSGRVHGALLVAAREVGISEVYKLGSAWAIGALAFGTQTVPATDVIVGPGNQYVAEAKRQVMGRVRIDMLAGPSEVLVIADEQANPEFVAADMLAQAEHDPQALALVITTSESLAARIGQAVNDQLASLERASIARRSLQERGAVFIADSVAEAIDLANEIAIEHLELHVRDPWQWLAHIRHAGAIFLGPYTPEAAGDYLAGPNHVLPTMGTARIASALGVETFLKKSSVIAYSRQGLTGDAEHIRRLASLEGLGGHANSVTVRLAEGR